MGIYNYSSGSWALVLRVIYLINLTDQKWYVTELKWIWPVIVSGDSLEIISSPDAKDWCDLKKNTLKYFIPLLLTSLLWEDNYKASRIFQWVPEVICRNLFCFCCFCHIAWPQPAHTQVLSIQTLGKISEPPLFCWLSQTNKCKEMTISQNLLGRIWQNLAKYLSLYHTSITENLKPSYSWTENFCDTNKFHMMMFMLKISKKLFG